ncbi:hypothetical protein B4135_0963 [Caldibacillus debilis]|uniref:Uncharacterized protein n=1 Tax=Caldibacillus debilis TaxID=301148 RepID=A0A150MF35_9BACI|nr:hypothetical protein B4135_0963 [Caldibacillus debilis]
MMMSINRLNSIVNIKFMKNGVLFIQIEPFFSFLEHIF